MSSHQPLQKPQSSSQSQATSEGYKNKQKQQGQFQDQHWKQQSQNIHQLQQLKPLPEHLAYSKDDAEEFSLDVPKKDYSNKEQYEGPKSKRQHQYKIKISGDKSIGEYYDECQQIFFSDPQLACIHIMSVGFQNFKAVALAELIKRRVPGLHQLNYISTEQQKRKTTLNQSETFVSFVIILQIQQPQHITHYGYQSPLPITEVKIKIVTNDLNKEGQRQKQNNNNNQLQDDNVNQRQSVVQTNIEQNIQPSLNQNKTKKNDKKVAHKLVQEQIDSQQNQQKKTVSLFQSDQKESSKKSFTGSIISDKDANKELTKQKFNVLSNSKDIKRSEFLQEEQINKSESYLEPFQQQEQAYAIKNKNIYKGSHKPKIQDQSQEQQQSKQSNKIVDEQSKQIQSIESIQTHQDTEITGKLSKQQTNLEHNQVNKNQNNLQKNKYKQDQNEKCNNYQKQNKEKKVENKSQTVQNKQIIEIDNRETQINERSLGVSESHTLTKQEETSLPIKQQQKRQANKFVYIEKIQKVQNEEEQSSEQITTIIQQEHMFEKEEKLLDAQKNNQETYILQDNDLK